MFTSISIFLSSLLFSRSLNTWKYTFTVLILYTSHHIVCVWSIKSYLIVVILLSPSMIFLTHSIPLHSFFSSVLFTFLFFCTLYFFPFYSLQEKRKSILSFLLFFYSIPLQLSTLKSNPSIHWLIML